jgi:flagellar biosynthesis/type III secretory pathway M-ring protein FliF/YscJ
MRAVKAMRQKLAEKKAAKAAAKAALAEGAQANLEAGAAGSLPAGQDKATLEGGLGNNRDPKEEMRRLREQLAVEAEERERLTMEAIESLRPGEVQVSRLDILQKFISEEIEKEPERMAHIVRVWLRESE